MNFVNIGEHGILLVYLLNKGLSKASLGVGLLSGSTESIDLISCCNSNGTSWLNLSSLHYWISSIILK